MGSHNRELGQRGEADARQYLLEQGYQILATNYRCRWGEIDVVAQEGEVLCIVEVKARTSRAFGYPEEAVDYRKQNKLRQLAQLYVAQNRWSGKTIRFDVIAVEYTRAQVKKAVRHYRGAF